MEVSPFSWSGGSCRKAVGRKYHFVLGMALGEKTVVTSNLNHVRCLSYVSPNPNGGQSYLSLHWHYDVYWFLLTVKDFRDQSCVCGVLSGCLAGKEGMSCCVWTVHHDKE